MKLIARAAGITSFSKTCGDKASGRVETLGQRTVRAHSQQYLQSSETYCHCVIERHLAQTGRISRSVLITIFSAALICGIPTHAQERIDPSLQLASATPTRTLFISPGVAQSNALEDSHQNPTPSG